MECILLNNIIDKLGPILPYDIILITAKSDQFY